MKKFLLNLFIYTAVSGCCESEIVASYSFTEFEKSFIPYTGFHNHIYQDNTGDRIVVRSQPRKTAVERRRPGPESCAVTQYESAMNFLYFGALDLLMRMELVKLEKPRFNIQITFDKQPGYSELFVPTCSFPFGAALEDQVIDTTVYGSEFENVLILKSCTPDTQIKQIFFSAENGVEFMEFADGNWWKFIEKVEL